jgi:hypothetical protein
MRLQGRSIAAGPRKSAMRGGAGPKTIGGLNMPGRAMGDASGDATVVTMTGMRVWPASGRRLGGC